MKKIFSKPHISYPSLLFGSLLFGASVNMFLLPHGIVTGGVTGIATTFGKLWGFPVRLGIILINLPILAICIKENGIGSMLFSIIGTLLSSVSADALSFLPSASSDPLLSSLIGGAAMGAGAGLMLTAGFTTGGTDLAAYLIHLRYPVIPTGRLLLVLDALIILISGALLGNFGGIMYSALCTVTYSAALDMVQSTSRRARTVFVISDFSDRIAAEVSRKIDRGVTLLCGQGYFSGKEKRIIMCVVGKQQEFPLRRLVLELDPSAFIVISEASEVTGNGFGKPFV